MKQALVKSFSNLVNTVPIILSTILLVALITVIIPDSFYTSVFSSNATLDSILGALIGSISAGSPIVSYILGGELLEQGIGLIAITSFLVAWVTVGLIQLPAESSILGKNFAIIRNISAFILSIIVAVITVTIFNIV